MNLKKKIRQELQKQYGDFNTVLEHQYEEKIVEKLIASNEIKKKEWITYNQVILELKHTLKNILKVKQLQYMLTENLNPNTVCIEVIKDVKDSSPELERLFDKINNF